MRRVYPGLNGRPVGVDLARVDAILDEGDDETHLFTATDIFRVRAAFADIERDWVSQ